MPIPQQDLLVPSIVRKAAFSPEIIGVESVVSIRVVSEQATWRSFSICP